MSYHKAMLETASQIFKELDELETAAVKLRNSAAGAQTQTDLEVAICSRQLADMRAKNIRATQLIDQSIKELKALK